MQTWGVHANFRNTERPESKSNLGPCFRDVIVPPTNPIRRPICKYSSTPRNIVHFNSSFVLFVAQGPLTISHTTCWLIKAVLSFRPYLHIPHFPRHSPVWPRTDWCRFSVFFPLRIVPHTTGQASTGTKHSLKHSKT